MKFPVCRLQWWITLKQELEQVDRPRLFSRHPTPSRVLVRYSFSIATVTSSLHVLRLQAHWHDKANVARKGLWSSSPRWRQSSAPGLPDTPPGRRRVAPSSLGDAPVHGQRPARRAVGSNEAKLPWSPIGTSRPGDSPSMMGACLRLQSSQMALFRDVQEARWAKAAPASNASLLALAAIWQMAM